MRENKTMIECLYLANIHNSKKFYISKRQKKADTITIMFNVGCEAKS